MSTKHPCPHCDRVFNRPQGLGLHLKSHRDERDAKAARMVEMADPLVDAIRKTVRIALVASLDEGFSIEEGESVLVRAVRLAWGGAVAEAAKVGARRMKAGAK